MRLHADWGRGGNEFAGQPVGVQLIIKFAASFGTRKFIALRPTARHWAVSSHMCSHCRTYLSPSVQRYSTYAVKLLVKEVRGQSRRCRHTPGSPSGVLHLAFSCNTATLFIKDIITGCLYRVFIECLYRMFIGVYRGCLYRMFIEDVYRGSLYRRL
jgi:hypothetical protein